MLINYLALIIPAPSVRNGVIMLTLGYKIPF